MLSYVLVMRVLYSKIRRGGEESSVGAPKRGWDAYSLRPLPEGRGRGWGFGVGSVAPVRKRRSPTPRSPPSREGRQDGNYLVTAPCSSTF